MSKADSITVPQNLLFESGDPHNIAFSPSERHRLRSTLSQVRLDLEDLDDTLAHLEAAKKRLLSKREALQMFSDTQQELNPLAHSIPEEILADIFSYFKPNWEDSRELWDRAGPDTDCVSAELFVLTHVCQQWRQAALYTPSLWNHIVIHAKSHNHTMKAVCAKSWLKRAGDCALSINIQCRESAYQDTWTVILDVVLPLSRRWRRASIAFKPQTDFQCLRGNLPLLETLSLEAIGTGHSKMRAFEIAPKLTNAYLTVDDNLQSINRPLPLLLWHQLTLFEIRYHLCVQETLDLLRMMPDLVSFKLHFFDTSLSRSSVDSPLQFP